MAIGADNAFADLIPAGGAQGFTERAEGFSPTAYPDLIAGTPVIGYGTLLDEKRRPGVRKQLADIGFDFDALASGKQSITPEEAAIIKQASMGDYERLVDRTFGPLPANKRAMLVDMAYQSWNRGFTPELIAAVRGGDDATAQRLIAGTYPQAAGLPGLQRRAEDRATLYLSDALGAAASDDETEPPAVGGQSGNAFADLIPQKKVASSNAFADLVPGAQPQGFFSALGSGISSGVHQLGEQAAQLGELAYGLGPESAPKEQTPDPIALKYKDTPFWEKIVTPEWLGYFLGQTSIGSLPFLGGALAGGVAGAVVGGPTPATIATVPLGALIGAATGGGTLAGVQTFADSYADARRAKQTHDQAVDSALVAGLASAGINAASVPAGILNLMKGPLTYAITQLITQPVIGGVDQATQNVIARATDVDPKRGLWENVPESMLGELLFEGPVQAAATRKLLRPKTANEPPPAPEPPPQGAPQTEAQPVGQMVEPAETPPAPTPQVAQPVAPPADLPPVGSVIGLKFEEGPQFRATIDSYLPDGAAMLHDEGGGQFGLDGETLRLAMRGVIEMAGVQTESRLETRGNQTPTEAEIVSEQGAAAQFLADSAPIDAEGRPVKEPARTLLTPLHADLELARKLRVAAAQPEVDPIEAARLILEAQQYERRAAHPGSEAGLEGLPPNAVERMGGPLGQQQDMATPEQRQAARPADIVPRMGELSRFPDRASPAQQQAAQQAEGAWRANRGIGNLPSQRQAPKVTAPDLREHDADVWYELARRGGVQLDSDLAQIFDGVNPFVPGAGRLFRENGRFTPDYAREHLEQLHYLPEGSTVEDFYNLMERRHFSKEKIFPEGQASAREEYGRRHDEQQRMAGHYGITLPESPVAREKAVIAAMAERERLEGSAADAGVPDAKEMSNDEIRQAIRDANERGPLLEAAKRAGLYDIEHLSNDEIRAEMLEREAMQMEPDIQDQADDDFWRRENADNAGQADAGRAEGERDSPDAAPGIESVRGKAAEGSPAPADRAQPRAPGEDRSRGSGHERTANEDIARKFRGEPGEDVPFQVAGTQGDLSSKTLGQAASAISRAVGAKKTGEGHTYGGGGRSRYYKLPDGRDLRVSDHEFPHSFGGGVAHVNVVIDPENGTAQIAQHEVELGAITKRGEPLILERDAAKGPQTNIRNEPVEDWIGFGGDGAAWTQAVMRAVRDAAAGREPKVQPPTTERTDQGEQYVLPGAEKRTPAKPEGKQPEKAQKGVDDLPLFDRNAPKQGSLLHVSDAEEKALAERGASETYTLTADGKGVIYTAKEFNEHRKEVYAAVKAELRRLVGPAHVLVFDEFWSKRLDGWRRVAGVAHPVESLIAMGLSDVAQPMQTVRHEAVHLLRQLRLITPEMWGAVSKQIPEWRKKFNVDARWKAAVEGYDPEMREAALNEEAVAEAFGHRVHEDRPAGAVARLWDRLAEILDRVRNAVMGNGFRSWRDVFHMVDRGELAGKIDGAPNHSLTEEGAMFGVRDNRTGDVVGIYPHRKVAENMAMAREAVEAQEREWRQEEENYFRTALEELQKTQRREWHGKVYGGQTVPPPAAMPQMPSVLATDVVRHLSSAGRFVGFPYWVAQLDSKFSRLYHSWKGMQQMEHSLQAEFVEGIKPLKALPKTEQEKVFAVLEGDRMQNTMRRRVGNGDVLYANQTADLPRSKVGDVVRLTGETATAFWSLRQAFSNGWTQMEKGAAAKLGYTGTLSKQGIQQAHQAALAAGDKEGARIADRMADIFDVMEDQRRAGYMPLMRRGDYFVRVVDSQPAQNAPRVPESYLVQTKTPWSAVIGKSEKVGRIPDAAFKMVDDLRGKYPGPRYKIEHGYISEKKGAIADLDVAQIDELIHRVATKNEAIAPALYDEVMNEMYKALKAGFRKKAMNIPGYSQDFERNIAEYFRSLSSVVARMHFNNDIEAAYLATKSHPSERMRDYARSFHDRMNSDASDFAGLRRFGFFMFLSGSVAPALMNATQTITSTIPNIGAWAGPRAAWLSSVAFAEAGLALRIGGRGIEVNLDSMGKTPAEKALVKKLAKSGELQAQLTHDLAGSEFTDNESMRGVQRAWNRTFDVLASAFGAAEVANRVAAALTAYRAFNNQQAAARADRLYAKNEVYKEMKRGNGGTMTPELMAEFMVDQTQYPAGKLNRPPIATGPGAVVFQFKSYGANTIRNLYQLMTRMGPEGKVAGTLSLAALMAMSGLYGFPFAEDAKDLAEAIMKLSRGVDQSIDFTLRRWLQDEGWANWASEMLLRGPSRQTGMDFGRRLGQGDLIPRFEINDMAGAPVGGMFSKVSEALARYRTGQPLGAAGALAPKFVTDIVKATGVAESEGISTIRGKPIKMPSEITAPMRLARSIGFAPTSEARARERLYEMQRLANATKQASFDTYVQLARYSNLALDAEKRGNVAAAEAYRQKFGGVWDDNSEGLSKDIPDYQKTRINRNSLNRRIREFADLEAWLAKNAPRNARGALQEFPYPR